MKKLLILESILIIFFVLAWNVSNSNEKTPGHRFCDSIEFDVWNLKNYYLDRIDEGIGNEILEGLTPSERLTKIAKGEDKIFKEYEEILIKIERRMSIYDKFCSGQYPAIGLID